MMLLSRITEPVEYDARLNRGQLGSRIDRTQRIHVTGKIEDDRNIGTLARKTRTRAARKYGRSHSPARRKSGLDIGGIARQDDADG
jgi:hypothetical protein